MRIATGAVFLCIDTKNGYFVILFYIKCMPEIDGVALPSIDIEYNLVGKEMSSEDIRNVRAAVVGEIDRLMEYSDETPFGSPIIETRAEDTERFEVMVEQLQVSLRYLDEKLEEDAEICGQESVEDGNGSMKRTGGVRLPLYDVKQRGRHAAIVTQNSWGSVSYSDLRLQEELRSYVVDSCGKSEETYRQVLSEMLRTNSTEQVNTDFDVQVLSEDDRVDIYDADNEKIGWGTVREARGNRVELYVHAHHKLHKNCYLRKKSNRRALETYKQHILNYCIRLGITDRLTDRHGKPYEWSAEDAQVIAQNEHIASYRNFSPAEQMFFGLENGLQDRMRQQMEGRDFTLNDVPRALLDDSEQSVAFGLGAMGHPCYLIQGPPGTGKTTVASHLVAHFQKQGLKTLVLSHSNRGLDVLLQAIKKRNTSVKRGGTEMGSCHHSLHDDFIRRGLKAPDKHDFMTKELDTEKWWAAMDAYNRGECEEPNIEDYRTRDALDVQALKEVWYCFNLERDRIIQELSQEEGLVAGVTLNSLISDEIIQSLDFDVVIVDEASRGYIYELLPALERAGKQIIFIGDHKQLGNIELPEHLARFLKDLPDDDFAGSTVEVDERSVAGFEAGPFEFMAENTAIPQVMLATDRRSLPGHVELVSKARYDGKLKAGRYDRENPANPGRMTWVDTASRDDRLEHSVGVSKGNHVEARLIARRLAKMYANGELDDENFGVIAMYSAQVKLIIQAIQRHPFEYPEHREGLLKMLRGNIGTVDSFQGSERDIVLLSLTRSNEEEKVGFTSETSRLNVAFSRARDDLMVFGDSSTVIENNPDEESREFFTVVRQCIDTHGQIVNVFPQVGSEAMPEEAKSQSYNARKNRHRRRTRRQSEKS